jgi:hypothetical protein
VTGSLEAARQALTTAVTSDDLVVTTVPSVRTDAVGSGIERYTVAAQEAATFVDTSMPYLKLAEEPRVRVEILNGNGRVGATAPVAAVLVRAGYRVVLTDNADRQDYQVSRIIAQGADNQEAAVATQRLLGTGEVRVEQRQPSGLVDLTIIIGSDLVLEG